MVKKGLKIFLFLVLIVFLFCNHTFTKAFNDNVVTEKLNITTFSNKINIRDIYTMENDTFLIVGSIDVTPTYRTNTYESSPYIAMYQNNKLVFDKIISTYGYGEFSGVAINGGLIYVCGSVERKNAFVEGIVLCFDKSGNINKSYVSPSTNTTTFDKIIYENNQLFITGITCDNSFYHGFTTYNKLFVLNLKNDLKYNDLLYFGNDSNNLLMTKFSNDSIYIRCRLEGEGDFKLSNTNKGYVFVRIGYTMDVLDYLLFDDDGQIDLIVKDDQINIVVLYNRNPYIRFITLTKSLMVLDEKLLQASLLNYTNYSFTCSYAKSQGTYLLSVRTKHNDIMYNKYIILDNDYEVLYEYDVKSDEILFKTAFINGYIYSYLYDTNHYLIGEKIFVVTNDLNNTYFNGVKANKRILTDVKDYYYGEYDVDVEYFLGDLSLVKKEVIKIDPICNVSNNETYDLGLVLNFNSDAYLNNEKINNGFKVEEEGVFVLELRGNKESIYYTFRVKDLCLQDERIDNSKKIVKLDMFSNKQIKRNNIETYKQEMNYFNHKNNELKMGYNLIICIGLSLVSFIITYYIVQKKIKKGEK